MYRSISKYMLNDNIIVVYIPYKATRQKFGTDPN